MQAFIFCKDCKTLIEVVETTFQICDVNYNFPPKIEEKDKNIQKYEFKGMTERKIGVHCKCSQKELSNVPLSRIERRLGERSIKKQGLKCENAGCESKNDAIWFCCECKQFVCTKNERNHILHTFILIDYIVNIEDLKEDELNSYTFKHRPRLRRTRRRKNKTRMYQNSQEKQAEPQATG